jgi:hypothetical protein
LQSYDIFFVKYERGETRFPLLYGTFLGVPQKFSAPVAL